MGVLEAVRILSFPIFLMSVSAIALRFALSDFRGEELPIAWSLAALGAPVAAGFLAIMAANAFESERVARLGAAMEGKGVLDVL